MAAINRDPLTAPHALRNDALLAVSVAVVAAALALFVDDGRRPDALGWALLLVERLDRETVAKALDDIAETCRSARGELRTTLEVLREHPPDARGPLPGLDGLPDLAQAARLAGARVEQTVRIRQAPPAVGAAAYRIVQEALTNAVRHAGPDVAVRVELDERQGALHLSVSDDGTGPAPGGTPGFGLVGMRERARSVGGTLDAGPRPGGGFEVAAVLPLTTTGKRTG
jgi:signal transduction histidine kinase